MGETPRKLRKSKDRIIFGVCAGIAEWLGWDVTVTRVVYVVVSIMSAAFPGILFYILLAILMPAPAGNSG